jgi:hypothetical protein
MMQVRIGKEQIQSQAKISPLVHLAHAVAVCVEKHSGCEINVTVKYDLKTNEVVSITIHTDTAEDKEDVMAALPHCPIAKLVKNIIKVT